MTVETFADPMATMQLLTGDDWAPWFVETVDSALKTIHLTVYMISPYWRGPGWTNIDIVETLANATRRGVEGRLIVDQPNVPYRTRPFNIDASLRLAAAGWRVRVMPDARTLHEKLLIVDKELSVIGSHNISRASATSNYDTSIAIRSPALAERLYRQFWQRWRIAAPLRG